MPQGIWSRIVSKVSTFTLRIRSERSQRSNSNSKSAEGSAPWENAALDSNYQGEGWLHVDSSSASTKGLVTIGGGKVSKEIKSYPMGPIKVESRVDIDYLRRVHPIR